MSSLSLNNSLRYFTEAGHQATEILKKPPKLLCSRAISYLVKAGAVALDLWLLEYFLSRSGIQAL